MVHLISILFGIVIPTSFNGLMKMFLYFKVATQSFLQGWNIALIVIGVVAFIIGDGIAGGLGTMLAMKSVHLTLILEIARLKRNCLGISDLSFQRSRDSCFVCTCTLAIRVPGQTFI